MPVLRLGGGPGAVVGHLKYLLFFFQQSQEGGSNTVTSSEMRGMMAPIRERKYSTCGANVGTELDDISRC